MRVVLILEYNGSNYCGWQSQLCNCSIQDKLEVALSRIADEKIRVVTAGRTDAGVHALYQVVHFDTTVKRPSTAWMRGVNTFLPKDIAVLWASEISSQFHARFSASSRCYQYLLLNHPIRPGIFYHNVGWYHQPLDLKKMRAAAQLLLGEHDFSAFRAAECQAKSPVRTLTQLDISSRGNMIMFDLSANAFLHHMVRNIIGCLVYVGKGRYSLDWFQMLLENGDRAAAAPTFSASGLYLADIIYDPRWNLPRIKKRASIIDNYRFL
ncbi:tRNA pseudouridine(38-40) synthase TruA [Nitrosomonas sp.]|uniref:tRNA pseudouridine(38-40) synthase TruA n=1 Tax=Nitrosomonas sp. TaxID=42353 RepID=UPI00283AE33D|nr:tRNA pseudouridine(38-40) synthase TruA [Nitrosomonas sp.]MDR4513348.1 tRNA pseudouridine(38-40) synthase TruA [Nitrosomonas sp.]